MLRMPQGHRHYRCQAVSAAETAVQSARAALTAGGGMRHHAMRARDELNMAGTAFVVVAFLVAGVIFPYIAPYILKLFQ